MHDYLIVGGGSAGCVLAARLSEDPSRRVLLLEAGADAADPALHPALFSPYPARAYFDPANIWAGLTVATGGASRNDGAGRPRAPYAQARLLGGGSSINGIGANRGAPGDYDEWEAAGAKGWSWENVLPTFRQLERDLDLPDDPLHGAAGPLPVRRLPRERWAPFAAGIVDVLRQRGVALHADQNGAWTDGVFPTTVNLAEDWTRASTARAYLTAAVRARPNLEIRTGVTVTRLILEGRRVTGVAARRGGDQDEKDLLAREIVLSAGALHTPGLMQASGLGPAPMLAAAGVTPLIDLPGVGENLLEHPSTGVAAYLPRQARQRGADDHHIPAVHRFSSGHPGCPDGDMHMALVGRAAWHAVGRRTGLLFVWVNKAWSRGRVALTRTSDGAPAIDVDFRLLSDQRDRARLADAFVRAAGVMEAAEAAGHCLGAIPARMSDRAKRYGNPSLRNRAVMGLAAAALDLSGPFAGGLLARMAGAGVTVRGLCADRDALDRFLDETVVGVWHASGTCRMGADGDPRAVTDAQGRVRGVEGLRVCDASLFPTIPRANINIPVIMVAERIARMMRAGG